MSSVTPVSPALPLGQHFEALVSCRNLFPPPYRSVLVHWRACVADDRDDPVLTSPFCHEGVDIHEGCEQLERNLEPRLFPEKVEGDVSD